MGRQKVAAGGQNEGLVEGGDLLVIAHEQQQVEPGSQRGDGLDGATGVALRQRGHVEGVADRHAREAQLVAKQVPDDRRGHAADAQAAHHVAMVVYRTSFGLGPSLRSFNCSSVPVLSTTIG